MSEEKVAAELEAFVRQLHAHPDWRYALERLRPNLRQRVKRILKRTRRFRPFADRLLGRKIVVGDEERFWASLPEHHSK